MDILRAFVNKKIQKSFDIILIGNIESYKKKI